MPEDDLVRFRDPEIAALAAAITARLAELADQLTARISQSVDAYGPDAVVPLEDLRTSCRNHLEFLFDQLTRPGPVDLTVPRATGRRRADQGAPLAAIMDAYRLGSRFIWDSVVDQARRSGPGSSEPLVRGASDIWALTDAYTEAMISAYRDAVAEQMLRRQQERSAFVEALLSGRITDTTTPWEAANVLRLPYQGPFVVVAAEVPELAREALPGVENLLGAQGIGSVWRLSPDLQLGVASLRGVSALERLTAVLREAATSRVGVSPSYTDLADTPRMLHFARIALASSPPGGNDVARFDDAPLSVVVASAPDTATRIARTILGPLLDLPGDERGVLLDTLATWFTSRGVSDRNRTGAVLPPEHGSASAAPRRAADRPIAGRPQRGRGTAHRPRDHPVAPPAGPLATVPGTRVERLRASHARPPAPSSGPAWAKQRINVPPTRGESFLGTLRVTTGDT